MNQWTRRWRGIAGLLLGILVCVSIRCSGDAIAHQPPDPQAILNDLQQVDVIYLGETHDRLADHQAQLDLIQQLYATHPMMEIAMEMFQRPYQDNLDQYLSGEISDTELREQTEYDQRWGFPWSYYLPILEFARTNQLPVIALNVPTEITRQVAQNGLSELSEADRQWIPDPATLDLTNTAYREMLRQSYEQIHQGSSYSLSFENFFLAQVLWDETMAMGIADVYRSHPDEPIVALVGQGHLWYGYGIPDRVARRLADDPSFSQRSVLLNPDQAAVEAGAGTIADYFWIAPER